MKTTQNRKWGDEIVEVDVKLENQLLRKELSLLKAKIAVLEHDRDRNMFTGREHDLESNLSRIERNISVVEQMGSSMKKNIETLFIRQIEQDKNIMKCHEKITDVTNKIPLKIAKVEDWTEKHIERINDNLEIICDVLETNNMKAPAEGFLNWEPVYPKAVSPEASSIRNCPICKEKLEDRCIDCNCSDIDNDILCAIVKGTCSHVYHHHCILRWLKQRDVCPICYTEWEFMRIEK